MKKKDQATGEEVFNPDAFYKKHRKLTGVPVFPLEDSVFFPGMSVPITVTEEADIRLARSAAKSGEPVLLVAVRQEEPEAEDSENADQLPPDELTEEDFPLVDGDERPIYRTGVIGYIFNVEEHPAGENPEEEPASVEILVRTHNAAEIDDLWSVRGVDMANVHTLREIYPPVGDTEVQTLMNLVSETYVGILSAIGQEETKTVREAFESLTAPLIRVNFVSVNSPLDIASKQKLLETRDMKSRVEMLLALLKISAQLVDLKAEMNRRTDAALTQQQKEHFLRQQINTMQDELGGTVEDEEMDELDQRAEKKKWSEKVQAHYDKEMRKLERFNASTPEYGIQYGYIETLLNLPWEEFSPDDFEIPHVEEVLDRDHYGLEKVKERIVEQVAVMKLRKDMKAPILCLYGPPGVGKTSLGKSIADALGREYARIALGGVHDEAEIRGHRRTYVGAMPGRIIAALEKVGTSNPVFVLDEIDKIGQDIKGDPGTALLEVLDPEQNSKFHDNYLDIDYDLSKVMFIATANSLETVSRPLRDRMEIIPISGYVAEEKVAIAERHLVPKMLEEHGLKPKDLKFTPEAIRLIIDRYTRESGVRLLEKKIAKVIRKIAVKKARGERIKHTVTDEMVRTLLGREEVDPDEYENNSLAGVVTGLAWTSVGGEILFIETSLSKGKGEKLTLTGQLGDVMKESAVIAMQYIKAHAPMLGLDDDIFKHYDVHIHVPEGAIPKDGPSAGVTMLTSLVSAFTRRRVRPRLAMTGEITLRGKVLPVGGIKEKILAAKRAGITDILLCERNRRDIEEIKADYLSGLRFHYVTNVSEVLDFALTDEIDATLPMRE